QNIELRLVPVLLKESGCELERAQGVALHAELVVAHRIRTEGHESAILREQARRRYAVRAAAAIAFRGSRVDHRVRADVIRGIQLAEDAAVGAVFAPEGRALGVGAVIRAEDPADREPRDRRDIELLVEAAQTAGHLQSIRDVPGQLAEDRGIPKTHPAIVFEGGIGGDRDAVQGARESAPSEYIVLLPEELLLVLIERPENPVERTAGVRHPAHLLGEGMLGRIAIARHREPWEAGIQNSQVGLIAPAQILYRVAIIDEIGT